MQVSSIITMEDTPELRLGVRCVLLQLFEHNEKAYRAAVQMMEECGKAAIVHPTGTGKSYIAFKLIEEHPADTIFWLSPSEYIFKTQIENLKRQAPDISLANVHFYTYAKLMCCATEELEAIAGLNPTYIILDEFHRVGAECWGASTLELLKLCPDAKILGLSATNIRYLDNNRDMAEELFDGHIASEMTLGEAIVRGILPAPKYVTTVYQYQKELTRYQNRIDNLRSAGIQDVNQKYLDKPNFQGNAAVNYTDCETPWTRIIEHKWFEFGKDENGNEQPKTIISREYSSEWKPGDEPYYPVNDAKNGTLYTEYKKMADVEPKVIFGGRLGEYKYYDMDQVIAAALDRCEKEF